MRGATRPRTRPLALLAVAGALVAACGTTTPSATSWLASPPTPTVTTRPSASGASVVGSLLGIEGLITEEVEPGVYRVRNDVVRDLSSADNRDVVAGYDGGVWLLRGDRFFRLGSGESHEWPEGSAPRDPSLQVAPDGTIWMDAHRSTDGETWTDEGCRQECVGFTLQPSGTLWASWGGLVGHVVSTGWRPLDGRIPGDLSTRSTDYGMFIGFDRLFFTDAGDLYGAYDSGRLTSLYRYENEDGVWEAAADAYRLVDVGPDGTIWADGGIDAGVDASGGATFPGDGLARYAEGEWARWTAAELPEIRYGLGLDRHRTGDDPRFNEQFEVAPDGSLWFSLWQSADGRDPRRGGSWGWTERTGAVEDGRLVCDGLARFDGTTLDHFLGGRCTSMDIAADGSVWVLADEGDGRDLYVITSEAVAATD